MNDPNQEMIDEKQKAEIEKIQVVQPAVVVGFNRAGQLCVNVMQGNTPEIAIVMLQKMANEMLARVQYQAETDSRIMPAAPGALRVLEGMRKQNGNGRQG